MGKGALSRLGWPLPARKGTLTAIVRKPTRSAALLIPLRLTPSRLMKEIERSHGRG